MCNKQPEYKCIYCSKTDGFRMAINAPGLYYQHYNPFTDEVCEKNLKKMRPDGSIIQSNKEVASNDRSNH